MNSDIVIKTKWTGDPAEQEELLKHEWLVTNGLGGYASRNDLGRTHPPFPQPFNRFAF